MFGNPGPFSYSPGGFSPDDLPQQRRGFQPEDLKGSPLQRNNMSRPSGRSIYMQRKEYSESLNRPSDNFHFRVEHLFTCDLDGQEVKTVNDCLAKLKRLDAKGRLWPQEMILEVQGGYLLLCDIETKSELESMHLSSIQQTKAVLDSCAYNSLLTLTVQERSRRIPQVFMFQCEDTGAELIKTDLDKVIQRGGGGEAEPIPDQMDIRTNLKNIIGLQASGSFHQPGPRAVLRETTPPPPEYSAPQWNVREPENLPPSRVYIPPEDLRDLQISPDVAPAPQLSDTDRNTEILNHVLDDLEIFMSKVSAAANASLAQEEKSKKKKKKSKKKQAKKNAMDLPSWEEYVSCLQKIKYGFNLLGQLDGSLTNPSAEDFVHIIFTTLGMLIPQYPLDLPPTVLSPLLTDPALHLLSQVVSPEEDALWRSLGDTWNIPRSRWPDDNVPPYIPEFYDGWQPPPPSQNRPMSRSSSQRRPPEQPYAQINNGMKEPPADGSWMAPPPPHSNEPLYMRVIYDFTARKNQELSIMKGEMVQVIQKNKQWWLVRNNRAEEGHVPQNVLEPITGSATVDGPQRESRGPPTLDLNSTVAEVKAWLEYKGFSKITVSSLGVLNGKLLLGMSRDEIRTVCPEEGGRVFFQLQAVKSAIALSSEPSGLYNSHY